MNAQEWKHKLITEIDNFWRDYTRLPEVIYMGYTEDMDFRAHMFGPCGVDIIANRMFFKGVEIIRVCKESYLRVI